MKKKILIVCGIVLIMILVGVIWWKVPTSLVAEKYMDDVTKIKVFDGAAGEGIDITDKDMIEDLYQQLCNVKLKKKEIASRLGYSLKISIFTGEKVLKEFIINSEDAARTDIVFYDIIEGGEVYDTLYSLFEKESPVSVDEATVVIEESPSPAPTTYQPVTLEEIGFQVPSIENVQSIEWVTGGVPAYATKKTIIEAEDVQHIMDMLNDIQPQRVAVEEEYTLNGGIGHHIRVNCTDGQTMTLKLASNRVLLWNENYYIIEELNFYLSEEWDSLPYKEELIREEGLKDFLAKDSM